MHNFAKIAFFVTSFIVAISLVEACFLARKARKEGKAYPWHEVWMSLADLAGRKHWAKRHQVRGPVVLAPATGLAKFRRGLPGAQTCSPERNCFSSGVFGSPKISAGEPISCTFP